MAVVRTRTRAAIETSRALDREVSRSMRGEPRYPACCTWLPADRVSEASVAEAHGRGMGVVIVSADGEERFLPAPEPGEPEPWPWTEAGTAAWWE